MNIALIYISPNGTTRKTTNAIRDYFITNGHEVQCIDLGDKTYRSNFFKAIEIIKKSDVVGFGSPVYHLDILPIVHEFINTLGFCKEYYEFNFKTFIYINYAGITSGKALINAANSLKNSNLKILGAIKVYAPHFFQKDEVKSYKTTHKVQVFCESIIDEKNEPINWNEIKKIFRVKKVFIKIVYPFIHIIGKKRELPIIVNMNKCKNCGKCIKECPKGAISNKEGLIFIDFKKCIHCYHCVSTCKFQAIRSPIENLKKIVKLNKKIIGKENPINEIFLSNKEVR